MVGYSEKLKVQYNTLIVSHAWAQRLDLTYSYMVNIAYPDMVYIAYSHMYYFHRNSLNLFV